MRIEIDEFENLRLNSTLMIARLIFTLSFLLYFPLLLLYENKSVLEENTITVTHCNDHIPLHFTSHLPSEMITFLRTGIAV